MSWPGEQIRFGYQVPSIFWMEGSQEVCLFAPATTAAAGGAGAVISTFVPIVGNIAMIWSAFSQTPSPQIIASINSSAQSIVDNTVESMQRNVNLAQTNPDRYLETAKQRVNAQYNPAKNSIESIHPRYITEAARKSLLDRLKVAFTAAMAVLTGIIALKVSRAQQTAAQAQAETQRQIQRQATAQAEAAQAVAGRQPLLQTGASEAGVAGWSLSDEEKKFLLYALLGVFAVGAVIAIGRGKK